ncbi:MAG: translation elongation factor Ts [Sedimentisphaerales bacterium]|nr:translation elongation factor Ts [Sedimentisphaerales bacterium]
MAEIGTDLVVKLRKLTGQGMMECKHALQEAGGDMEKAVEILRKKGLASMDRRADRQAKEGLVVSKTSPDGRTAVLAALCCETDFVARTDDFGQVAARLADYAMACQKDEGPDALAQTTLNGRPFLELMAELISKTGEKISIGDYARFRLDGPGLIGLYVHFNRKVGSMVQLQTSSDSVAANQAVKTLAADLAMHSTAARPMAIDKSDVDPEVIAKERAIYAEQVKGKPAAIIDKIVDGKLAKFFAENCLLLQRFVKDDEKTVQQIIDEVAKAAGGTAKVVRFVRIAVGA